MIILATNNTHKLREFSEILGLKVLRPSDFGLTFSALENGSDFESNAMIKAKGLLDSIKLCHATPLESKLSKIIILADDSGLCVDSLNGMPGIYSARFANFLKGKESQENSSDKENKEALKAALREKGLWGSKAKFVCAIAYIVVESFVIQKSGAATGECEGIIALKESGEGGFGYDSMFYIDNIESKIDFDIKNIAFMGTLTHSLANIDAKEKNKISHRYKALTTLKQTLRNLDRI